MSLFRKFILGLAIPVLVVSCAETPNSPDDLMLERAHGTIGGLGSQYATRQLPSEGSEITFIRPEGLRNVASAATYIASVHGQLIGTLDLENGTEIKAMIGSGYMNMNPAIVSILVSKKEQGSGVIVKATAKEGLIKQNTSEKAVKRIAEAIQEYLDSRPSSVKPTEIRRG